MRLTLWNRYHDRMVTLNVPSQRFAWDGPGEFPERHGAVKVTRRQAIWAWKKLCGDKACGCTIGIGAAGVRDPHYTVTVCCKEAK